MQYPSHHFDQRHLPGHQPNWWHEFDRAIVRGDEEGMWLALSHLPDQDAAMRELADKVPRLSYQRRGRLQFSELMMVPVLSPAQSPDLLTDDATWRQARACLEDAAKSWFLRTGAALLMFPRIRPYHWIGTWRPSIIRQHLMAAVPGQAHKSAQFVDQQLHLPSGVPRLGFIALLATTATGWLRLPAPDYSQDHRFSLVVSSMLHVDRYAPAPVVKTPSRVQEAVPDGLCLWLNEFHKAVPIVGWTTSLQAGAPDVVRITLKVEDAQVPLTQFTVRMHQVGTDGLTQILSTLCTLAPMLDQPFDVQPARQQPISIDLT